MNGQDHLKQKKCVCCVQARASKRETHSKQDHTNAATGLWEQTGERSSCYPWRLHAGKMGSICNASQSIVIHTSYQNTGKLNYGDVGTTFFLWNLNYSHPFYTILLCYKIQRSVCHLNLTLYTYNYTIIIFLFKFEVPTAVLSWPFVLLLGLLFNLKEKGQHIFLNHWAFSKL
jgi:hypothetical protein